MWPPTSSGRGLASVPKPRRTSIARVEKRLRCEGMPKPSSWKPSVLQVADDQCGGVTKIAGLCKAGPRNMALSLLPVGVVYDGEGIHHLWTLQTMNSPL